MSREHVFAIALSAGSTAVVFLLSPAWGSFFLAVSSAAFVLYWHSGRGKVPRIEQYPVRDALNFKITNGTVKAGLGGVELRLNRLQRWDGHRTEFGTVSGYRPMVLYSDQVDLPYRITRTFQILDVTDRQNPRVHGKLDGKEHWWPLGGYGVWAADLDLLWGGGHCAFTSYVQWTERAGLNLSRRGHPRLAQEIIGKLLAGASVEPGERIVELRNEPTYRPVVR